MGLEPRGVGSQGRASGGVELPRVESGGFDSPGAKTGGVESQGVRPEIFNPYGAESLGIRA